MKRQKLLVSNERLRRLLEIPEDVEIVFVEARQDPPHLQVMLTAADMPEVPDDAEAPIVSLGGIYGRLWTEVSPW